MRKILFLLLALCALPLAAQESFYDRTEVTQQGDTLDFSTFAGNITLVFTSALSNENAQQYHHLLEMQSAFSHLGFLLMELHGEEFSDLDVADKEPKDLYLRSEYDACTFTFPLVVDYNLSPIFRFLYQYSTPALFVTHSENPVNPDHLVRPLHKWLIDREGRVVKIFDPTVSPFEIAEALKEFI